LSIAVRSLFSKKNKDFLGLEDLIFLIFVGCFLCYKEQNTPLEREKIHFSWLWTQPKKERFSSAAGKKFILKFKLLRRKMQRIPIVVIVAIVLVVFYYYPPLRNLVFPGQKPTSELPHNQNSKEKDDGFDKLGVELYTAGIKLDNLRGKIALLTMAKNNKDWFKPEEYDQLPSLLAKAEEEFKQVEAEYEKTRIQYAQENVRKLIKEAMAKKDGEQSKK
jgi:hypothetical protein